MFGQAILGSQKPDGGFATYPPDHDYYFTPRGAPTVSGVNVSEESAMGLDTVFACVNKLSKTIATLPVHVYKRLPGDRKENIPDHPVRRMFTVRPNDEALAVPTRWAMMANLLLWGNAYFEVLRDRRGTPLAMALLLSRYMTVERDKQTGQLVYEYRAPGEGPVGLGPERVWHIPGMGYDGLVGQSVIGLARKAVGLGLAATQFREAFLGNAASPGLVLKRPKDAGSLSPEAGNQLVNSIDEKIKGSGNAFRTIFLREDMSLETIGMPQKDAQFVELTRYDTERICGIFDVPPAMIHDNANASYNTMEQQGLQWSIGSLTPPCVLIENAADAVLLDDDHYMKHNLDGLQRGDFKSRQEGCMTGRQGGWLDTNDCRRINDLDPVEGGDGDFLRPLNMTTKEEREQEARNQREMVDRQGRIEENQQQASGHLSTLTASVDGVGFDVTRVGETIDEASQRQQKHVKQLGDVLAKRDQKLATGYIHLANAVDDLREQAAEKNRAELCDLLLDPATRIVAKETKTVAAAWKRHEKALGNDGFLAWLDKFYTEHQDQLYEFFRSMVAYVATQVSVSGPEAHAALRAFAEREAEVSRAAVRDACLSARSPDEVSKELDRWKEDKPRSMAYRLMERLCAGATETTEEQEEEEDG